MKNLKAAFTWLRRKLSRSHLQSKRYKQKFPGTSTNSSQSQSPAVNNNTPSDELISPVIKINFNWLHFLKWQSILILSYPTSASMAPIKNSWFGSSSFQVSFIHYNIIKLIVLFYLFNDAHRTKKCRYDPLWFSCLFPTFHGHSAQVPLLRSRTRRRSRPQSHWPIHPQLDVRILLLLLFCIIYSRAIHHFSCHFRTLPLTLLSFWTAVQDTTRTWQFVFHVRSELLRR